MNPFAQQLIDAGMDSGEAIPKGQLFDRAIRILASSSAEVESLRAFYVPGRIEILGKHTDYAGGRSLLCTVERGFCLVAQARKDALVRIINARSRSECTFALDPELKPTERGWCAYPNTVLRRLARNFPRARRGADIAFVSDLPAASGMSSSSAFMVSIFLALSDINALEKSDAYRRQIHSLEDLAGYLGTVENGESFGSLTGDRGVGTFGGSEDHTAILCCRAGEVKQYSFCPIRFQRTITLPPGHVFVIGVSGIVAIKTGAARTKYNRASLAARKILEIWRAATGRSDPTIAAALAGAPEAAGQIREALRAAHDEQFPASLLCDRFEQFVQESTMVIPSAGDALAAGDFGRFGLLVDRSQHGAETLLGNQVPETIALARSARDLGAAAASAFGAGFGGSVWALIRSKDAAEFKQRWAACYQDQFPAIQRARFFTTRPGPSALRLTTG